MNSLRTDLPSPRLFANEGLTSSTMVNWLPTPGIACSRLRDGGGKSFSNKKCEKRAGAGIGMCSCKYLVISRRG